MARYETKHYVATDEGEAACLAAIDGSDWGAVRITPDAEPLHTVNRIGSGFTFWTDRRFTRPLTDTMRAGVITEDAERELMAVLGADGGRVEGGIVLLTELDAVLARESVITDGDPHRPYQGRRVERLHVRWRDGSASDLWVFSVGYGEGYLYDVYRSRDLAERAMRDPFDEGAR